MTKRNRPKRPRAGEHGAKEPAPAASASAEEGAPPTQASPPKPRAAGRRVSEARQPGGPSRAGRTAGARSAAAPRASRPAPAPSATSRPGVAPKGAGTKRRTQPADEHRDQRGDVHAARSSAPHATESGEPAKPVGHHARKAEGADLRRPEGARKLAGADERSAARKRESRPPTNANGPVGVARERPEAAALHEPARTINGTPAGRAPGNPASPSAHTGRAAEPAPAAGESDDDIWSEGLATAELAAERDVLAADEAPSERPSSEPATRLTRGSGGDRVREAAAFGSAQSLLSTDYYFRQYGAHGMRSLAAEVDDFGFDPHVDDKLRPLLEAFCKRYFRVALVGAEQVPAHGRALLVANRAGALPWDGLVLRTALRASRPSLAPLRWLAEDTVIHYPFMGVLMNRLGAVRACPENAERLLAQDRLVAVFPEGAQGSRKLFRDRYRLQRFGRGGYVKLALKLGVPLLPTAIIGAEETNPVLGRSRLLGRLVGSEFVPLTPTFPWLGLAGLWPAPVRWRIVIGEPIDLSSYGPKAADDALVVHRLNEQIRASLQALVDQGKVARGGALFG